MFDMTTVSLGSNLSSPMSGSTVPIGNMTPSSVYKYSHSLSPHSPMSSPPGSITPTSTMSNGKSMNNSNSKDGLLSSNGEMFSSKCKRKINFSHLGIPKGTQPGTVARRNARERNRVKQVNNGFASLKQHIPLGHRSKKMSKVETLKCAVDYIKNLKAMLDSNGAALFSTLNGSSNAGSSNSSTISSENDSSDQNHFGSNSEFPLGSEGALGQLSHNHQHPHHHHHHQQQQNHHQQHLNSFGSSNSTIPYGSHQLSPTSSVDPSSPSYASEASYITSSSNKNASNNNTNMYDCENYEPVSPEEDELLEAISWWQQS